jgi:hypothetical protein
LIRRFLLFYSCPIYSLANAKDVAIDLECLCILELNVYTVDFAASRVVDFCIAPLLVLCIVLQVLDENYLVKVYIAQALVDYIMVLSPQKIILGGGVMHQESLFPLIRKYVAEMMNGYLKTKELEDLDTYIVPASLNDDQGLMGGIKLAMMAAEE